jgi:hypothetical protein
LFIRKHRVLFCGLVFLLALSVRLLTWQDNFRDIWKVQTSVVQGYWDSGRQLAAGDFKHFVSDINHFGHPPGYPILLAAIFKTAGDSTTALHIVQIVCDSIAVVLLFLIALELLPATAAIIAAVLAAISPQFAYFSVLLLPDSLVVAPILLAVYLLVRARRDSRLLNFVIAGALIGIACWFRANSFLLPFFLAATAALTSEPGKRMRAASAVIAGALIVIAPITIKNAIVYHRFVPLSLGAGQTLLEGIADYDEAGRFNIPLTDLGLMRQEAEWSGKPEYAQLLFGRDGIERDRMRLARGFAVIRSHPFWFASVMLRRGIASTRLDPVPVLARESPVSRAISGAGLQPIWEKDSLDATEVINIRPGNDYVFHIPLKLKEGRLLVKITDAEGKKVLASTVIDLVEGVSAEDQPMRQLAIPFVSGNESTVRLAFVSGASQQPVVEVGRTMLFELGPSSQQWLRYVRMPIGFVQQVFKTAWVLPLVVIGLVILVRRREWRTLAIILTVPAYYLIVQSALHTERRYVYVIHYFFLLLAATTLASFVSLILDRIYKIFKMNRIIL